MQYAGVLMRRQIKYSPKSIRRAVITDGILHKLWTVNANWNDDGWNVNANSIDNPNDWNAGNQVFSRYSRLSSPTLFWGSFLYGFFSPTTNVISDGFKTDAERSKLFIGHQFVFPKELDEESDVVNFNN